MTEIKTPEQIGFTIRLIPVTKKNSQKIIYNKSNRRVMVIPSEQYRIYERDAKWFMPKMKAPIDRPVNIRALFFLPTRRRTDLVNLEQALLDIMVKYGVIADDNYTIVASMDGSRVFYDKENPRTEVTITYVSEISDS